MRTLEHPIADGNRIAQKIYTRRPDGENYEAGRRRTELQLRMLGARAAEHYKHTSMAEHAPKRAINLTMRAMWRANLAPILHGIEIEYDALVQKRLQHGQSLSVPQGSTTHLERLYNKYGNFFQGKERAFLLASGWWSNIAAKQYLVRVMEDQNHPCAPVLNAYPPNHHDYLHLSFHEFFRPRGDHLQYLRDITITSNVTTLSILRPAALHAALWPAKPGAEDGQSVLLDRATELAWPQSVSNAFMSEKIARKGPTDQPCPFAHSEAQIAAGSIWQVQSLQNGPWNPERYCPANIPLIAPDAVLPIPTSAATMRMTTNIYVASSTLF